MVFDAIEKYIHPSRYRQIVETESVKNLTKEEQDVVSQNQKHSSVVARVHYQKQHSRDLAKKGQECMKKLQGVKGEQVEQYIQSKLCDFDDSSADVQLSESVEDQNLPIDNNELGDFDDSSANVQLSESVEDQTLPIDKSDNAKKVNIPTDNTKDQRLFEREIPKPLSKPTRLRFTSEEDKNLKAGLLKHGNGHWTAILKDKQLKFQSGRKADSLRKRAESKFRKLCT